MEYILHRINTVAELETLDPSYGVELDLRDGLDGRIYLQHEPFIPGDDFEKYLKSYCHGTMIFNVKSERIEWKIIEMVKKYGIKNYFFLDSTFPMIKALSDKGEKKIALRFSEFEGMDTIRSMQGKAEWIWVDCFTHLPLNSSNYAELKQMGYKICLVSPELEAQPDKIECYQEFIDNNHFYLDAVCSKRQYMQLWTANYESVNNLKTSLPCVGR